MKKYIISHSALETIDWLNVPEIKIESYQKKPEAKIDAAAQVCWSKERLCVRLTCTEPSILARYSGECDPVYRDSCLEMFLCPKAEDGRYFNFEFNPNGASFFGFGYGRDDRIRLHPLNIRKLLNIRNHIESCFWEIQFDIPVKLLQLFMPDYSLIEGRKMRGNFYTCGDDVEPNHELMWNLITNGINDFHQSAYFGELVLG